jgi:hypothetical protein
MSETRRDPDSIAKRVPWTSTEKEFDSIIRRSESKDQLTKMWEKIK